MKTLPAALATHLASRATTMCWCWRLTRRDGVRLGFTDHDHDLIFDATTFEAAAGFTASEIREGVGLGVDNMEVEGALSSGRLDETALAGGIFDGAEVEVFRVNWAAVDQRVLIRSGNLGEVRRTGLSFSAEVRGLAQHLQQPGGRLYQYGCDADVGDERCQVDMTSAAFRGTATISTLISNREFSTSGLSMFESGWFTRGLLQFNSGANAGRAMEIKRHVSGSSVITMELWQEPPASLTIGDAIIATAGCDKHVTTCVAKFANRLNFRGFPHMPGNDFVTTVARTGRGSQRRIG